MDNLPDKPLKKSKKGCEMWSLDVFHDPPATSSQKYFSLFLGLFMELYRLLLKMVYIFPV